MVAMDWGGEAVRMAEKIGREMFPAHRGAMPFGEGEVTVAFGNDCFRDDRRAQEEVEFLRDALALEGIGELGFGVDPADGYSWAMIVNTRDVAAVDDLVWRAGREAFGEGGTCSVMQRCHAHWAIARAMSA